MHETTVARCIVDEVERLIGDGTIPGKVQAVCVRVGRLSCVAPDSLETVFGFVARGTSLEGSTLRIEEAPARGACRSCGKEFEIAEADFLCPGCSSPEVDIRSGEELRIEAVEVE
jgi:hydrogenase nickel incorporation protein HypA/HybF